jgi:alpha-ketoglutarate-dependent taurine dioxygenase
VGELPATPAEPTDPTTKEYTSEFTLLTLARRLGHPVGYLPEHGGEIVQNLVPTRRGADHQTSTSSAVTLDMHTETAFHPFLPRYLVLLCLRGDPEAATTYVSIEELAPTLPPEVRAVLREPRFRCGVDESFGEPDAEPAPAAPVLWGTDERPCWTFDEDLTFGLDADARAALAELRAELAGFERSVVLEAGDLLVLDNTKVVHGRTPFRPRFDGSDRWLQRTFVVADLAPSATQRRGRIIATTF